MAESLTVNDLLDGHVALDLECLDRIYLNGYVPNLQVAGQVVRFMTQHLGYPIPYRPTFAAYAASRTSTNCRPRAVTSTPGCSILNASGRVVSLRAQPLSGSRSPRSPRTGGGPQPYGSATLGSWPCSAPCVSPSTPSGSPTGASVPT